MNRAAHHDRAEDAPEEHAVLERERHAEVREDQRDHHDVVEREAVLDQIRGEVELRPPPSARVVQLDQARAVRTRVGVVHDQAKRQARPHPDAREQEGLARAHDARRAVEDPEVEGERAEDDDEESDPHERSQGAISSELRPGPVGSGGRGRDDTARRRARRREAGRCGPTSARARRAQRSGGDGAQTACRDALRQAPQRTPADARAVACPEREQPLQADPARSSHARSDPSEGQHMRAAARRPARGHTRCYVRR